MSCSASITNSKSDSGAGALLTGAGFTGAGAGAGAGADSTVLSCGFVDLKFPKIFEIFGAFTITGSLAVGL